MTKRFFEFIFKLGTLGTVILKIHSTDFNKFVRFSSLLLCPTWQFTIISQKKINECKKISFSAFFFNHSSLIDNYKIFKFWNLNAMKAKKRMKKKTVWFYAIHEPTDFDKKGGTITILLEEWDRYKIYFFKWDTQNEIISQHFSHFL